MTESLRLEAILFLSFRTLPQPHPNPVQPNLVQPVPIQFNPIQPVAVQSIPGPAQPQLVRKTALLGKIGLLYSSGRGRIG